MLGTLLIPKPKFLTIACTESLPPNGVRQPRCEAEAMTVGWSTLLGARQPTVFETLLFAATVAGAAGSTSRFEPTSYAPTLALIANISFSMRLRVTSLTALT